MLSNFAAVLEKARGQGRKKIIAVAAAHDQEVLESVALAKKEGLAEFVLVGNAEKIKSILKEIGENLDGLEIVAADNDHQAAKIAAECVANGKADMPMKGNLHTSAFLKSVFNKELGLIQPKALVSQITVSEYPEQNRLLLITDCAINISPTYEEKMKILTNCVAVANRLEIERPKVACIAAVETVNPVMQETIDAAMLSKAAERGQLKNCEVDGPLAMDNALSKEAASVKGIKSAVAGAADILLMPNLTTGNAFDKSLRYLANLSTASVVAGAKVPLIMTSRSDSAESKLRSIALSVL